jgi:hypothetical protein
MKYKIGDRVLYVNGDPASVARYKDSKGNPGVWEITGIGSSFGEDSLRATVLTGPMANLVGILLPHEVVPSMKIESIKRSTEDIGLKIYGKVQGESGKTYNFGYIRRTGFRGWICSCENFFFQRAGKNQNCKHLHFVRDQVGRYGAKVPSTGTKV